MMTSPSAADSAESGPRPVADNRRRRPHLRELCDEVLASFRLARERDVVTEGDRQAARTVLAQLTPLLRGAAGPQVAVRPQG